MKRYCFIFILSVSVLQVCFAQETGSAKVIVKPFLQSYTQARVDLQRDSVFYKQEKMIFGLDFVFNENWSARAGFDLIRMNSLYVKPAVLTFRKVRWTVDGGIFFTSEIDIYLQQLWNNRFIEKVAADRWLTDPTADLGLRVAYRWNDLITTDVSLVSGNGYQRLKEKYHPKPAFRMIITPVQPLKMGAYIGARKEGNIIESSFNCFANIQINDKWKATGEYHHQINSKFGTGRRLDVASVYGTYSVLSWMSLLGRYDYVKSNRLEPSGDVWKVEDDGRYLIGGLIFRCFQNVRLSVNYWNKRPAIKHVDKEDWLYVCLEFKY